MSGSPKFATVDIDAEQTARLEAIRLAAAAEEARVREAAAEAARQEALNRERVTAARRQLVEIKAVAAGLRSDQGIVKHFTEEFSRMEETESEAARAFELGEHDRVAQLLQRVRTESAWLIREWNSFLLKKARRDYVSESLAACLREMGFVVQVDVEKESELGLISGVNASRRVIQATVPISGNVQYEVDGYERETFKDVDGRASSACDEAEATLNGLSELLRTLGVETGALMWEGKDPDRLLRNADFLPRTDSTRRGKS